MKSSLLIDILLVVVIIMGLSNFAAQFVIPEYKPDPVITGAFMGLAGIILGVKGKGEKSDKE